MRNGCLVDETIPFKRVVTALLLEKNRFVDCMLLNQKLDVNMQSPNTNQFLSVKEFKGLSVV